MQVARQKITRSTLIVHARRLVMDEHPNAELIRSNGRWMVVAGLTSFPSADREYHAWENAASALYEVAE